MSHTTPAQTGYHKRKIELKTRPPVKRGMVKLPPATRQKQAAIIKKYLKDFTPKATLCLLIAAHDEELVIAQTINSAITAGMKPQHIYVVDDNSSDKTSEIAKSILGEANVARVKRSGKGVALTKASKKFNLTNRYRWIHIADADGGFAPNYFKVFRGQLRVKYAAATGYVRSLPGGPVSQYRVFEITIGLEIHRRFQAITHTVPIIPGPTSCFRSDVFARLDFANRSLTEDFDVTLQIHRQKLGKIQYIPDAIAYTQDPKNTRDFIKQILRWNRGIMQGVHHHRIGRKLSPIDAYLSYQILQNFLFFFNYCILMPFYSIRHHSLAIVAQVFLFDVVLTLLMTMLVAIRTKRWDILSAFPFIYAFRWLSMAVFLRSFVEVVILKRFLVTQGTWSTAGRRYKSEASI
jgi:cellulose synthase/poly-beta-1,6-N-acetylglucosamine synthase-like glycosyltransferase